MKTKTGIGNINMSFVIVSFFSCLEEPNQLLQWWLRLILFAAGKTRPYGASAFRHLSVLLSACIPGVHVPVYTRTCRCTCIRMMDQHLVTCCHGEKCFPFTRQTNNNNYHYNDIHDNQNTFKCNVSTFEGYGRRVENTLKRSNVLLTRETR